MKYPRFKRPLLRAASVGFYLIAWHLLSTQHVDLGIVTFQNVPTPGEVFAEGWNLLQSKKTLAHLTASLSRVFGGFVLAGLVGIVLGLCIGSYHLAADLLLPPLELLRPIPAVAWIPLAILMFPSTELSMTYITFTGALFPILLNTIHGVVGVDARLLASARSLGARQLAVFHEVILPGAAQNIFTGLSIGMGTAWFCLVTAEMIAGQFGIGYYTWSAYTIQNYAGIVVGMLLIGGLGLLSSQLVKRLGQALTPWHRPPAKAL
ncbi:MULTISPECIES: ABC transporter permease [Methylomonas]|uniref:ABC transporter permease n=2 Tax=Methylomonas TaxID=416 RepID=A0A126T484_9GAMM|nr:MULTISPECIES: ABC transporter permease [Methylomonas]AMK76878.1 ABC transporter permease [Methylomonas denitrificans]OAI01506.1 ABC transporter permease [Methylomonas methanica]TCV74174.1 NitT/TauT family transport system permease protein [Methylomonas methanica]